MIHAQIVANRGSGRLGKLPRHRFNIGQIEFGTTCHVLSVDLLKPCCNRIKSRDFLLDKLLIVQFFLHDDGIDC